MPPGSRREVTCGVVVPGLFAIAVLADLVAHDRAACSAYQCSDHGMANGFTDQRATTGTNAGANSGR